MQLVAQHNSRHPLRDVRALFFAGFDGVEPERDGKAFVFGTAACSFI